MTYKEEITKLIRASYDQGVADAKQEALAALENTVAVMVEAEREACAKVCDEKVNAEYATGKVDHNEMGWTQACAIEIRARGEKK